MKSASKTIEVMLQDLNPRQKDVLVKRFCLDDKSKVGLTLAELGEKYGVTRERIRQIEESALRTVREKIQAGAGREVLAVAKSQVEADSGVSREDAMLAKLVASGLELQPLQLRFFLEAEGKLEFHAEDNDFHHVWYKDAKAFSAAKLAVEKAYKYCEANKEDVLSGKLQSIAPFKPYLAVSKKFGVSRYGSFGLVEWPEISPKTVRDRAYLVLKEVKRPVHFRDIAELIEQKKFDSRQVHASTVHNELIKDGRFVLVGRGMYALSEHGYFPGTTREVIARVLRSKGPLHPEAIVKHVLSERQFKENTILLNLQNKKIFKKLSDGRFHLAEV